MAKLRLFLRSVAAASVTSVAFYVFAVGSAAAQSAETLVPAEQAAPSPANIDDVKLNQFADAYVAVQAIQKDTAEKQSTVTDSSAITTLASESRVKMTDAVQKSGLQVEEFNQIAQLMAKDMDLRAKISEKVQQRLKVGG